jgi:trimeric autotransporter adhesin
MSDDPRSDNDPRFDQAARNWLELGPMSVPERTVQAVLLAVESTSQRRGLRTPWRTTRMMTFSMTAAAVAVTAIVSLGSLGVLEPSPAPGAAMPPTACPTPLASGGIATIAGTGGFASPTGPSGDGGPATEADISPGMGIAVDDAGNVYFSEEAHNRIRRIGTDGIITTVAGPSTGADLGRPGGLAFDANGTLYVSDLGASRVWRVEKDGSTTAVVGTGTSGSSGNEGPAIDADVQPAGLAIGPQGDLYFDDLNNYRRVDADGIIHAFAGSTTPGFEGDGGPAVDAMFGRSVIGIAIDRDGSVYLGDPGNLRIRKVDPSGTISTVAGTGKGGPSGDGGPALEANLTSSPYALAVGDDGSLFFSEWQRGAVRKIDPSGIVTTVAGGGTGFENGDCGVASEASLMEPQGIAVHGGVLYVVDAGHNRIRVVVP